MTFIILDVLLNVGMKFAY